MFSKRIKFLKKLLKRYLDHGVAAISAQMAYNWILAFFPFLIFLITLATYTPITITLILDYVRELVPETAMTFIENTLSQFIEYRSPTLLSVGVIASIWTASTAVKSMIRGVRIAYDDTQIRPFWRSRLVAIMYTVLFAIIILALMIFLVFGNIVGHNMINYLKFEASCCMPIWNKIRLSVSMVLILVALYLIYRFIPKHEGKYRCVWPGTITITLVWYVFSMLFSLYIDNYAKYNQMYGSIGGIFVLLIWLYASCTLIIIGGEINGLVGELKKGIS